MLTSERILELYNEHEERLAGGGSLFHFDMFAQAIEREATAPLIEQIKEDEALMLMALDALSIAATWMPLNHRIDRVDSPIESLHQRLGDKK